MKSRRGNIQKQSGTESIHVSQFGFTRTDVRLIVVERPSMTRHESIGTRRRAKGGRGWCIVIRVTIIVGKNPGRDANNEVALIRGGGDLPEYRARNKNPVAPNDVRTFHTDFSLSLSFILYFSFFFFSKRRTFTRDAYALHYGLFNGRFKTRKYLSAPGECARTQANPDRPNSTSSRHRPSVFILYRVNGVVLLEYKLNT